MVVKKYKKGKQLEQLEKLKEEIKHLENFDRYGYIMKFDVSYDNVSLEIRPTFKQENEHRDKIGKDMLEVQKFLLERDITFSFTWWKNYVRLNIRDD